MRHLGQHSVFVDHSRISVSGTVEADHRKRGGKIVADLTRLHRSGGIAMMSFVLGRSKGCHLNLEEKNVFQLGRMSLYSRATFRCDVGACSA
jgi:hypothetical protein